MTLIYRYVSGNVRSKQVKPSQVPAFLAKGWLADDPRKAVADAPKKRGRPKKVEQDDNQTPDN